jgi:hypothetical protein
MYAEGAGHPEKPMSNAAFGTLQRADVVFQLRLSGQCLVRVASLRRQRVKEATFKPPTDCRAL